MSIFVVVVQSLGCVRLFATTRTAACQASLSFTISGSLLKLRAIQSVMQPGHLILCHPLLLPPSIFPSIRVFSNESALYIRWPKYWSFSFSISPSKEHSGLISFRIDWFDLLMRLSQGLSRVFSNTTVQKHQFFGALRSLEWQVNHTAGVGETSNCLQHLQKRSGGDGDVHEPLNLTCYYNAVSVIK